MRSAVVLALVILTAALPVGVAPATSAVYAAYPAPSALGPGAGEPSLGINGNTGSVFFQNFVNTLRVTFNDATMPATASWADVTPPNSILNVDPILFTDFTTGRTFAGGLDGQCSILAYTDDDGASWTPMGNACASPAYDHESIASGPWYTPGLPPPHTYDRAVYYCAQEVEIECATSVDGGITFLPAVPITTTPPVFVGWCGSLHGSLEVGPKGIVWLPIRTCFDSASTVSHGVAISMGNGRTWTTKILPGGAPVTSDGGMGGFDPDVATTPGGWAYIGYPGANGHPLVTLTKNNGTSFLGPWNVGASLGITNVSFTEMVAGDDDRATLVFLGTTQPGDPYVESWSGVWNLYAATTLDGGATWDTVQITTDPVQRGWMCADGINCPDQGTRGRNLLDFIDAKVDADGRVLVAFADGCIGACAGPSGTAAQSTSDYATIARQTCGPSLFASKGNVEGSTPCSIGTPPPLPPTPLAGTYYMAGVTPTGQTDTLAGIVVPSGSTLKPTPPTGAAPKVASNALVNGGANTHTFYDATWALDAPAEGYALNDATITVRLFVVAAGGNTAVTVPWKLTVALSDLRSTENAAIATAAFANATALLSPAPTPTEVVLTIPHVTRTLTHGLTITVGQAGAGETDILYDAAATPSRLVIS